METPTKTQVISGAEAVVKSILQERTEYIFGYPGGAIMPVYDSLYDYLDWIKHVLSRHEQGAIHMAQGYARVSGKVGVCFATSGPGATNLITGLADAQIDSTPLVCITGQVHSHLLGTDAFQESDVIGITTPVTKWNVQVTKAEDISAAIAKAFYISKSGRPGPVLVDITKDAQFQKIEYEYVPCEKIRSYVPNRKVNSFQIEQAAEVINSAKRPYVLFGQGVVLAEAEEEFKTFIEKAGLPAAWTILGLSALESNHPLNVGMLGMHGNYGPNLLTNECDVLIAVGMRFDDRVTGDLKRYATQARVIHLDIDPSEINKNVKADVPVLGNCKDTLAAITNLLEPKTHAAWLKRFKDCEEQEFYEVVQRELTPEKSHEMTMGEVINFISQQTHGEAVIVTDVGQHQMASQRYYRHSVKRSHVTSGGLGTMGFGLPAAIGAKLGVPTREVIAVVGDGGFQMTIQELGTIFQYNIGVKILVLNNEFLGMVRQWQELFFEKRYSFTEMVNPNFQLIASGYQIPSEKVTKREHLEKAIRKFLQHKGSYLLEVLVGKENNVFPMVPTGASVTEIRLK